MRHLALAVHCRESSDKDVQMRGQDCTLPLVGSDEAFNEIQSEERLIGLHNEHAFHCNVDKKSHVQGHGVQRDSAQIWLRL